MNEARVDVGDRPQLDVRGGQFRDGARVEHGFLLCALLPEAARPREAKPALVLVHVREKPRRAERGRVLDRCVVQSGPDPAPAMVACDGDEHEPELGVFREQVLEPRERPPDDAPVDLGDEPALARALWNGLLAVQPRGGADDGRRKRHHGSLRRRRPRRVPRRAL